MVDFLAFLRVGENGCAQHVKLPRWTPTAC